MMSIRRMVPEDHPVLLALWERSVRASHRFLTEADIAMLRPLVAEELSGSATEWWVALGRDDGIAGMLGYSQGVIEGLFIEAECRGQGIGSRLVAHAQGLSGGALRVDVNEANPEALEFYQARGFQIIGRSATDGGGRPFPLIHLRRQTAP